MAFWLLIAAALVAAAGLAVHAGYGRPRVMQALRAAEVPPRTLALCAVSWDMFSVLLAGAALTLIGVAFAPAAEAALYPVIGMCLAGAAVFMALAVGGHRDLARLPGAYLLALIGGLAWLAL